MGEVRIPSPKEPVAGEDGHISRAWWRFFHDLWQRTGGAGDITGLFTTDTGDTVQTWDADLDALAALSGTGLVARTAAATYAERTLTGPAAGISVSNGDGVSGNPTLALANDLSALEGLASTGIAVRTASDTWAQRTITAADGAFWADGDGVSGNPTIDVALQVFEVTVGQAALGTGGEVILLDAAASETWKVMDIWYDGTGTDFAGGGGDRLLDITDGTSIWSAIPAATLAGINGNPARWGDADLPNPATDSHMFTASASGADIVAKYSGGTTDYTAGSIIFRITAYRTA